MVSCCAAYCSKLWQHAEGYGSVCQLEANTLVECCQQQVYIDFIAK